MIQPVLIGRDAKNINSGSLSVASDKALVEKAREFETILLNQMIAAMEPKEGLFGKGFGGEYFQTIFRQELASFLGKDLDLGLAAQLTKAAVKKQL
jgi:Rod binding domain-containing protein